MIRKLLILTTLLSSVALPAYALEADPDVPSGLTSSDDRIINLIYDASDVYTIPTKAGYQTSIVFGREEEIQTISVGDRSPWQIIPSGNRLFIRPLLDNVATNMTVITSKRAYQFDIKSAPAEGGRVVYVVNFVYPNNERAAAPAPAPASVEKIEVPAAPKVESAPITSLPFVAPEPKPVTPHTAKATPSSSPFGTQRSESKQLSSANMTQQSLNYHYTYSGSDDLAPLQVYDDGISTFVKYRDVNQPIPNAYRISASGDETRVPSRIVGDRMVIDSVAGEFALKNSSGTVHIYNETLNPR